MKDENRRTLEAYENGVREYNAAMIPSVTGNVKDWIDSALAGLPNGAHILEIGSAHGRDADYMESRGFKVDRTDAAQSFVEYLKSQGHAARRLNALTDDYGDLFDMIYANAVLVHFKPEETRQVLRRARKALAPHGLFAFSVKIGDGSRWSSSKLKDPRFFSYWREGPLRQMLSGERFEIIYWNEGAGGHNNGEWFHVISRAIKT